MNLRGVAELMAAEFIDTLVIDRRGGRDDTVLETGKRHEGLVGRADRVDAAHRAVKERLPGRGVQLIPGVVIDAVQEEVRVVGRLAHEGENFAGRGINRDHGAGLSAERFFHNLLQVEVNRQREVFARHRRGRFQVADRSAAGRHFEH